MWYGALDEADPTELVEPELEAQRRARVAALLDAASIQESGLSTELRYLADGITGFSAWVVRHASEEPNIAGDIVNVVMGSAAHYLPTDLERMGFNPASTSIPINLFEVRVAATFDVKIFVLGKRSPVEKALLDGLYDSRKSETAVGWKPLLEDVGLHQATLELISRLMGIDVLPCSGVAVDDSLATYLERRAKSIWPTGQFFGADGKTTVASEEVFPATTAYDVFGQPCYDGAASRVVRASNCDRLVLQHQEFQIQLRMDPATQATGQGLTCAKCEWWKWQSLRPSRTSFATEVSVMAAGSHFPLSRLPNLELLCGRARNLAADLKLARRQVRIDLEKVEVDSVKANDDTSIPISTVCAIAGEEAAAGSLEALAPGADKLFAEKGTVFTQLWQAQVQQAKVLEKERARNPDGEATGRGMRCHPVLLRWAMQLYGRSRAAYRVIARAVWVPSERCASQLDNTRVFFILSF